VNDIINRISAASDEQADGIGEVNRAVGQMDDMTQQNAALVEEAAAAAASLHEQTVNLAGAISIFKIEGADAEPAVAEAEEDSEFAVPAERRAQDSPMRRALPDQSRNKGNRQDKDQGQRGRARSARG
jgi:methyl-accepting chemotaxis protein